jgi:DNA-binding MarR family transcriptional regulator
MRVPDDLPVPSSERLRLVLDVDLRLLTVADGLRQHWAAHAAALGLTTAQVKVLLILKPGEAIPMRGLAARLDYDTSNLSTLVDRLENRGTVERRSDPGDRRIKAVTLTAEGERLRTKFWRGLVEDSGPLAPLGVDNLQALASLLIAIDVDTESATNPRPTARSSQSDTRPASHPITRRPGHGE